MPKARIRDATTQHTRHKTSTPPNSNSCPCDRQLSKFAARPPRVVRGPWHLCPQQTFSTAQKTCCPSSCLLGVVALASRSTWCRGAAPRPPCPSLVTVPWSDHEQRAAAATLAPTWPAPSPRRRHHSNPQKLHALPLPHDAQTAQNTHHEAALTRRANPLAHDRTWPLHHPRPDPTPP